MGIFPALRSAITYAKSGNGETVWRDGILVCNDKIVAIVALIVVGVALVMIQFSSPSGNVASFTNLWNDGGMFPKGISGFFAGFQIAVFAFVGIELVGTTAAETKNPKVVLPRAINAIPIRIIMFYVLR